MTTTRITCKLADIDISSGIQPRTGITESVVNEYAQAMLSGDEFPPMEVFWDGSTRHLVSGYHRYFAHKQAGSVEVEVVQHTGTKRDAILFAVGTNADHGLRRSDDDKRRAVRMLLEDEEWSQWSDRQIAKLCRVSHPLVSKVREEVSGSTGSVTSERRYQRNGAEAVMDTANIGKAQRQPEPKPEPKPQLETVTSSAPAGDDGPSVAELLDEMQADVRRAEARVAELEKALKDGGKEQVVTLLQRLDHAERRQAELQEDAAKLKQARDFYERQLARCGKAVGQRDLDKVAPAVEAFVRAHSKVAA